MLCILKLLEAPKPKYFIWKTLFQVEPEQEESVIYFYKKRMAEIFAKNERLRTTQKLRTNERSKSTTYFSQKSDKKLWMPF